ncbi:FAD-dependent oxidoreductase [Sphingosinicella humi]|uniref:D-amino-acid oxidase n=1 Tax=Allosphingosinicella humi TaxID=2068657 RepID=A0A2U2J2P6_9SPHN|nr:FAD-dependent oxidoreductase [Sphingosinicella humi]PWG02598.1 FAD-dependent oxidoreductase [Sphingosinicella humi]
MLLDRRRFVSSSTLAFGGLALSGCATTIARPTASAKRAVCLPPVKVSADRVIRTVAGLRPYRAPGFIVRAEALGDKRLVHNYGHGGAGITLSWGTSKLATELGLEGHQGPVAVIGAGIMGLTTARLVQEAGFPVTLYTAALPPDTTSNIAGGQWSPFGHFRDSAVTPEWRAQFAAALDYSWRRFQIMVGEDYGVRWLTTYAESGGDPGPADAYHPAAARVPFEDHPFPVDNIVRFDTMYVETGRFLRQLMRDIQIAGGRFAIRSFASPAELAELPERLLFNCTGLGARALFGDTELLPVRGQLAILLPQPEVGYAFSGNAGYMFPRPDGIILGGTFERDQWVAEPQPEDIAEIIESHGRLFGGFRCSA